MTTSELSQIIKTPQRCPECGTFQTEHKHLTFWTCRTCHAVFTPDLSPDELDLLDSYKPTNSRPKRGGLG